MHKRAIGTRKLPAFESLESRQLFSGDGATSLAIGGTLFFSADGGNHANVLWKSNLDGSDKQLVKNTVFSPTWLTNLNGTLIFSAGGISGLELWRSDGTEAGTQMIKDIYTGGSPSYPHDFMMVNGHLIFTADRSWHMDELFVTDGTTAGTRSLLDVALPHQSATETHHIDVQDDTIYFEAQDLAKDELFRWKSDGTPEGTVPAPGGSIADGELRIFGTDGDDDIQLSTAAGITSLSVSGQPTQTFHSSSFTRIYLYAQRGNDRVILDDSITAPATIETGTGDNTVRGGSGDDYIDGGSGNESLNGGPGNDSIFGQFGKDTLVGGGGFDTLYAPDGNDTMIPSAEHVTVANDVLHVYGSDGGDRILVRSGSTDPAFDVFINGGRQSFNSTTFKSIIIDAGGGDDQVQIDSAIVMTSKIYGGAGNDTIHGGSDAERIYGGDGNDWIAAGAGSDTIYGEAGNDRLFGGDGVDYLFDGTGVNVIRGEAGKDHLLSNRSIDDIRGNLLDLIGYN